MTFYAELNGHRVTRATVHLPHGGIWHADVEVDTAAAIAGAATLTIGAAVLRGVVFRGGAYATAGAYRLRGGAGGWGKTLPARSYRNDFGIKLSMILADVAREAGEPLVLDAGVERNVGAAFVRPRCAAARTLADEVTRRRLEWWVATDGVTHVGTRAADDVVADYQLVDFDPAKQRATLATEAPEAFVPGRVLRARMPAPLRLFAVDLVLRADALRIEAWGFQ